MYSQFRKKLDRQTVDVYEKYLINNYTSHNWETFFRTNYFIFIQYNAVIIMPKVIYCNICLLCLYKERKQKTKSLEINDKLPKQAYTISDYSTTIYIMEHLTSKARFWIPSGTTQCEFVAMKQSNFFSSPNWTQHTTRCLLNTFGFGFQWTYYKFGIKSERNSQWKLSHFGLWIIALLLWSSDPNGYTLNKFMRECPRVQYNFLS